MKEDIIPESELPVIDVLAFEWVPENENIGTPELEEPIEISEPPHTHGIEEAIPDTLETERGDDLSN